MMYVFATALFFSAPPLTLAVTRRAQAAGWVHLAGLGLLFAGERIYGGDPSRLWLSGLGTLLLCIGLGLRAMHLGQQAPGQRETHRAALIWQTLAVVGVGLYGLTLSPMADAMAPAADAPDRFGVGFLVLGLISITIGTLPTILLDAAQRRHPRAVPAGARRYAVRAGLSVGLTLAALFPINYLGGAWNTSADYSYFRVTRPGSATEALLRNVDGPVTAHLFFAPSSEVLAQVQPYFDEVAAEEPNLTVNVVDQAAVPALAEELGIRDNGYVVLSKGESHEKFKIGTDVKRARRELKKLDGTVQAHLLKLARDKRVVYVMTGHGEVSHRTGEPLEKISLIKKALEAQNYNVKDFGLEQGSAEDVPDDAALVLVPAPEKALFDAEVEALERYVDGGGAMLVYVEPGRDNLAPLMDHLGLEVGQHPLAHASQFVLTRRAISDRSNLVAKRFGTHPSTKTLSKYASRGLYVAFFGAVEIREAGEGQLPGPRKATPLIRSFEDTWEDADGNFQPSAAEPGAVRTLAMAVSGPETAPYRVMVVGDVSSISDLVVQRSEGNAQFLLDATRWLVGDEELAGEISNEEDVRINHTREEDTLWFWGAVLGLPLLVMMLGSVYVTRRRTLEAR